MKPLLATLLLLTTTTACGSIHPPCWGCSRETLTGFDGKPLLDDNGQPIMLFVGAPSNSRVGRAIARRQYQAEASRSAAEFRYYRGRILRALR